MGLPRIIIFERPSLSVSIAALADFRPFAYWIIKPFKGCSPLF